MESAYGFTLDDSAAASQYDVPKDLMDIFVNAVGSSSSSSSDPPPSAEELESRKSRAEERKTKGNELMKSERYEEALAAYTDAISLNNKNAVYFCNRAAAHSKLGNHQEAVEDCVTALEIDPTYSKAYGRMGSVKEIFWGDFVMKLMMMCLITLRMIMMAMIESHNADDDDGDDDDDRYH